MDIIKRKFALEKYSKVQTTLKKTLKAIDNYKN